MPTDRKLFLYLGGLIGGGWGAKHNEDGMSATIAINDGDTHNGPSEQLEAKFPLLVERYALRDGSGGAGKQRGGLGNEQRVRVLSDIMFNTQIERVDCRPWGLFGGLSALGNEVALQRNGAGRDGLRDRQGVLAAAQAGRRLHAALRRRRRLRQADSTASSRTSKTTCGRATSPARWRASTTAR